jgi:hypothetical protein
VKAPWSPGRSSYPGVSATTSGWTRRKQNANKNKQMKGKLLSFAFIYFSESGLFKGLSAENKKNSLSLHLAWWL